MNEIIRKLKVYQKITGVNSTIIAKQSDLSRYTIMRMTNDRVIDFDSDSLTKIANFLNKKFDELNKLRNGEI